MATYCSLVLAVAASLLATPIPSPAQQIPKELGQGWLEELRHAANQTLALAKATPADQYGWRPRPGVRSVSEVYMHVAVGNYFLLDHAGTTPKSAPGPVKGDLEKTVTAKADVIRWLEESIASVEYAYPRADRTKHVKFFGQETTADAVFLRLLVHNHEHMGQAIAYARMMGIVPPWSK